MNPIIALMAKERILFQSGGTVRKNKDGGAYTLGDACLYRNSMYRRGPVLYCIGRVGTQKDLFLASHTAFTSAFTGVMTHENDIHLQTVRMTFENSLVLRKLFPFTAPISLRTKRTTIGCGDRLGLATPGQLAAIRNFDAYPVLAQQSIRELTLTKRTYRDVTAAAAFLVFQSGYERGYGADGDHLKTLADIDTALAAGMPMITLDLTNTMNPDAVSWNASRIGNEFDKLPDAERARIMKTYAGRMFAVPGEKIFITETEAKRCALMYGKAISFSKEVNDHIKAKRGNRYDLEISIDETTAPTLPEHHLFIIRELRRQKVLVNSLAPRFIGEFQKAIDYIGDAAEFDRQFRMHSAIAKANGNYKISVHSGSDKFAVYPSVGKYTGGRLHLKTAGTSWLEAVRTIAAKAPSLYRILHAKAFAYAPEALKLYHITADFRKIPDIAGKSDTDLRSYLDMNESRQLIHITYGGLLNDPAVRDEFFSALALYEEAHYGFLAAHFTKHLTLLGVRKR
ncbi:MAG: tagaturonate epimerase family protein [Spirochaetota bacterium]